MISNFAEGVAKGEDAMSILDNPRTRVLFIDDLMEVQIYKCSQTQDACIIYSINFVEKFCVS